MLSRRRSIVSLITSCLVIIVANKLNVDRSVCNFIRILVVLLLVELF